MDVLTAILACSLHVDDGLVRAIADSNSHGNPYAVVDPTADAEAEEPPPEPRSLDAALARVAEIAGRGGEPLLGLMQVPRSWAGRFGRDERELFDPCTNVAIGTAMLSEFDYECGRGERAVGRRKSSSERGLVNTSTPRRICIVRKYGDAVGLPDLELVVILELDHQRPQHRAPQIAEAPIFAPMPSPSPNEGGGRVFVAVDPAASVREQF
jgi:hypothetical protein